MKRIVFISGLGANHRAFEQLTEFSGYAPVYVEWITPESGESLLEYCQRLVDHYHISQTDCLIGLSFGGLIAQQIAQLCKSHRIILISSFRDSADLKPFFHRSLTLGLHKFIPPIKIPVLSSGIAFFLNSGRTESKVVLGEMLKETDMRLMKWSIDKIKESRSTYLPETTMYSLIGDRDKLIRPWIIPTLEVIPGGSHFMVYDQAAEVSDVIKKILE